MEGKGRLGTRNWEFSDHAGHAESMLKPMHGISVPESNASAHQAAFLKMGVYADRNAMVSQSSSETTSMEFWVPQRNFLSSSKSSVHHLEATQVSSEMIGSPSVPAAPDDTPQSGDREAKPAKVKKKQSSTKGSKCIASKVLKPKEPKKRSSPAKPKKSSVSSGKHEKKKQDSIMEGVTLDFSSVPAPVCSCTGVTRQCYRWGAGGWQSSCCTTTISEYPLPMSSSRPGARLAGRKMSIGAYGKLLQRLATEGHDLSYAVDLKNHWARHGTNKFVTIK